MKLHGFTLEKEQEIKELALNAQVWIHDKTSAKVLSIINDDENKVFGISFRTPPEDSTGIAHILEHSVLCGSKKYPCKEPFVELYKGSLQTFLNAMTYPDKTCYPVASTNTQDLYNLMDVYLDAVFFPNLTEDTLRQEGWHYTVEENTDNEDSAKSEPTLAFKGVVFNEMKGVYSSADSILYEQSQQSLFPDISYGLDSGGNPEDIPSLTFTQFMDFHKKHYHPSNSYTVFYGNDPAEKRLERLNAVFELFDASDVNTEVSLQKAFDKPVYKEVPYAVSKDDEDTLSHITVNFALCESTNASENMELHILEQILIGLPSSPLYKALADSGLGEDITGGGLEADLRQMFFSVGMKGVKKQNVFHVEKLIFDTLRQLEKNGIDAEDIDAALNSFEFALRENNTGSYPRGIALMVLSLRTWIHNNDPLTLLPFQAEIDALRKKIQNNEKVFEKLLKKYFIENNHRSTIVLVADTNLQEENDKKEKDTLAKQAALLGKDGIAKLKNISEILQKKQAEPDSAEALATIPHLQIKDLAKTETPVPYETKDIGVTLHTQDLATRGIAYLSLCFSTKAVPTKYIPYLSIFGRILLETGTDKYTFEELTRLIAQKTGDIYCRPIFAKDDLSGNPLELFTCQGKATKEHCKDLITLMQEILLSANLHNKERISRIITETKSRMEQSVIPSGHQMMGSRLKSKYTVSAWMQEQVAGIDALFFMRKLEKEDFATIQKDLENLRSILIQKNALCINLVGDKEIQKIIETDIQELLSKLPNKELANDSANTLARVLPESADKEAFTIPAQVNYVGKAFKLSDWTFHGSALVANKLLRTSYLWEQVRVIGGAYGGFSVLDYKNDLMIFLSYRDPNMEKTLAVYDKAIDYLANLEISQTELENTIIGVFGELDGYLLADAKGFSAFMRRLTNDKIETRNELRKQVLETNISHIKEFAKALKNALSNTKIAVLGAEESLKKSDETFVFTKVL